MKNLDLSKLTNRQREFIENLYNEINKMNSLAGEDDKVNDFFNELLLIKNQERSDIARIKDNNHKFEELRSIQIKEDIERLNKHMSKIRLKANYRKNLEYMAIEIFSTIDPSHCITICYNLEGNRYSPTLTEYNRIELSYDGSYEFGSESKKIYGDNIIDLLSKMQKTLLKMSR